MKNGRYRDLQGHLDLRATIDTTEVEREDNPIIEKLKDQEEQRKYHQNNIHDTHHTWGHDVNRPDLEHRRDEIGVFI